VTARPGETPRLSLARWAADRTLLGVCVEHFLLDRPHEPTVELAERLRLAA